MSFLGSLFNKKYENIDGIKVNNIIKNNRDVLILDVRTPGEFGSGHIPKSKNIPVNELSLRVDSLDLYKDEDVIVYCASGMRSASAAKILSKYGFNKVYNLSGGLGSYKGKLK
ncbi:rhodanese-like domain-containing protein [Romboutsia weinsteinii]|uniref:Rhodanese-like domain-containing protein n=1 Tax=Romboutsia weinsteinii TaxID=2020949 RepID=A0A371J3V9_9FIRM|nr:rhodanese-like domain-containing protein [Romboutsia weinsteinii]RDY27462.1 rhodanese-like domain-containing protein [Romboutsia weinsteinii]